MTPIADMPAFKAVSAASSTPGVDDRQAASAAMPASNANSASMTSANAAAIPSAATTPGGWIGSFLSNFTSYDLQRFIGYFASAKFSTAVRDWVAPRLRNKDPAYQAMLRHAEEHAKHHKPEPVTGIYHIPGVGTQPELRFMVEENAKDPAKKKILFQGQGGRYNVTPDKHYNAAKRRVGFYETLIYWGATTFGLWRERQELKRVFSQAVAAELGMNPDDVGLFAMMKSHNPMVQLALRRVGFVTFVHYLTDTLLSVTDISTGVAGKAFDIIFSRRMMMDKNDLDMLRTEIKQVQQNGMGNEASTFMKRSLKMIIGRVRSDCSMPPLSLAQMQAIEPVMDGLIHHVLTRAKTPEGSTKASIDNTINEVVYIVGQGLMQGDGPRAAAALEQVVNSGLRQIAQNNSRALMALKEAALVAQGANKATGGKALVSTNMVDNTPTTGLGSGAPKSKISAILNRGEQSPIDFSLQKQPLVAGKMA